jgi:hypothetical protein
VGVIEMEGDFSPLAMVEFRNHLAEMVEGGCVRVVVNLDRVIWISERGMGLLLESWIWLRRKGGNLKLAAGLSPVSWRLHEFGVDSWVEQYPSVNEALASPWPEREAVWAPGPREDGVRRVS